MTLLPLCATGLSLLSLPELTQLELEVRDKLGSQVVISPSWEMSRTKTISNWVARASNPHQALIEQRLDLITRTPPTLRGRALPIRLFPNFLYAVVESDRDQVRKIRAKAIDTLEARRVRVEKDTVVVTGSTAAVLPISQLGAIPLKHPIKAPKLFDGEVIIVSPGKYAEGQFVAAIARALGATPSKDSNVIMLDPSVTKDRWLAYVESTRRFAVNDFLTDKHEALILAAKYATSENVAKLLEDEIKYIDIPVSANVLLPRLAKRTYESYVLRATHMGSEVKDQEFRERFRSRINLDDPRPMFFRFYGTGHMELLFPANDGKFYVSL